MTSTSYSHKLPITEFTVDHAYSNESYVFDATAGKINSAFGYIVKGSCTIHSTGKTIELPQGSLYYIPDGVRYHSIWNGYPEIEHYCFQLKNSKFDTEKTSYFPIQVIKDTSTLSTGKIFEHIFKLFATGNISDKMKAISIYYGFFAKIIPILISEKRPYFSDVLVKAIGYIEKNYFKNYSVSTLADECHISESRLYHLFQKEMGTSPNQYRNNIRIEKAVQDIRRGNKQIHTIAYENGFNSVSYFYEVFKAYTGLNPAEFKAKNY